MELLSIEHTEKPVPFDILTYQAPFLIEKLLNDAIVEDLQEAEQLFMEVKRWMHLVYTDKSKLWEMYSYRIDAVWHQFILYTDEYVKFCDCYFGAYFSHSPGNAPGYNKDQSSIGTFKDFQLLYEGVFNEKMPDVWFDEKSIHLNRRLINNDAGKLFLEEEDGMVKMINADGEILLSVNLFATEAIAFIASTKSFYVRELPGDLTDEEKIMLIRSLVEFHILRVAS